MKKIAILGSTGSIGTQTLEVVRQTGELEVVALAAGSSVEKMEQQIREFHPRLAAMWEETGGKGAAGKNSRFRCKGGFRDGGASGNCSFAGKSGIGDGNCGNDWNQTDHCGLSGQVRILRWRIRKPLSLQDILSCPLQRNVEYPFCPWTVSTVPFSSL